ncbi:efflux transporter [Gymnopus androsaceus JB14]|uniref:Efflux transporter n=1 Tax=Gymnopus androsaceus JB14 TaxID=1447944 RepID=A0A6A4HE31_9AGAR|nr:efflux transporter [Gymnopus androsaceus JB14]
MSDASLAHPESVTKVEDSLSTPDVETTMAIRGRTTLGAILLTMTVTLAMMVNSFNITSVSLAVPTIGRDLSITEASLVWLVAAYSLSSGCLLILFGRVADLYGRKKTFLAGTLSLIAFTIGCSFAQDGLTLAILRGFQGIGAAATIPASLGIIAHSFPPSHARSVAFATFAAGAPLGSALGTILGGVITQLASGETWRADFWLSAGLTFLCLLGGMFSIDKDKPSEEKDRRIDWPGAFLVTASLVLISFVLNQGEVAPNRWATPYIIGCLVTGVVLMVIFLVWQHYLEKALAKPTGSASPLTPPPIMKLSLWKKSNGMLAALMCISFLNFASFLAWFYWIQLYYQDFLLLTPILTMVRMLPMFVTGVTCNVNHGAHSPSNALVTGTTVTSIACLLFAVIVPSAPYWAFGFPAAICSVFGADFVFAGGTMFVAKTVEPHEQSLAGALFQTMAQLGQALGVTITTIVFNQVAATHAKVGDTTPPLKAYQSAQWTAFGFAILATILGVLCLRGAGIAGDQTESDIPPPKTESDHSTGTIP